MIKEQLKILVQLAISDDMIAQKEARLIKTIGLANGMKEDEIQKIIDNPQSGDKLPKLSNDQKFEYLYSVVQLMKADGQVFKAEIEFAETLAEKLGYDKAVIGELSSRIYSDTTLKEEHDNLKEKARQFLK